MAEAVLVEAQVLPYEKPPGLGLHLQAERRKPDRTPAGGAPPHAYAEHVSGNKKPGEHEKLHGNAQQKGAYAAAVAAGMSIAVASTGGLRCAAAVKSASSRAAV